MPRLFSSQSAILLAFACLLLSSCSFSSTGRASNSIVFQHVVDDKIRDVSSGTRFALSLSAPIHVNVGFHRQSESSQFAKYPEVVSWFRLLTVEGAEAKRVFRSVPINFASKMKGHAQASDWRDIMISLSFFNEYHLVHLSKNPYFCYKVSIGETYRMAICLDFYDNKKKFIKHVESPMFDLLVQ